MTFTSSMRLLVATPEINPINCKAKSIPVLNPVDKYGRVFFFSWLGFMVAFLSWFAFPPLLTVTIKKDLDMSQTDIANSNIVALLATFLVRFISGPLCDRFGPRWVFIGILLAGAIPTAMVGLVTTPSGLIAVRFFVGILGASFVPCQVWTTAFFDKPVIGTANSLTAGWGNAGGGITYFVMPAIYDSLVSSQGLSAHKAWRVAFIVPFIIIAAVALGMMLLCDDTPTGKWSDRHLFTDNSPAITRTTSIVQTRRVDKALQPTVVSETDEVAKKEKEEQKRSNSDSDLEGQSGDEGEIVGIREEMVIAPTLKEAMRVIFSLSTLSLAATYLCSFGGELTINSILGSYYAGNFKALGQTGSGRWAAMFGLLNVVFRPLGGFISDILYHTSHRSVWAKKIWLTFLIIVNGAFLLAIGLLNPKAESTMFGLVSGLAFFLEAANGANFSVVPHVHPYANGIVSGVVGASGNLGGIIFNIVFRYNGTDYARGLRIMGIVSLVVGVAQSWIRPMPRGQIGGH